jgi:hypothetical protein
MDMPNILSFSPPFWAMWLRRCTSIFCWSDEISIQNLTVFVNFMYWSFHRMSWYEQLKERWPSSLSKSQDLVVIINQFNWMPSRVYACNYNVAIHEQVTPLLFILLKTYRTGHWRLDYRGHVSLSNEQSPFFTDSLNSRACPRGMLCNPLRHGKPMYLMWKSSRNTCA